jgi:hypothetical protein
MRIVGRCLLTVVRIVALILTIPLMLLSVSIDIVGKWVSLFCIAYGQLSHYYEYIWIYDRVRKRYNLASRPIGPA